MARVRDRLPDNVDGDVYVDASCIDCAICRQLAPASFTSGGSPTEQSYVYRQPRDDDERMRALMALVACPTSSIGSTSKADTSDAAARFPEPIEDEVFFCGYAAESSFGASSYLIRRADGNVLVDSPRFSRPLVRQIEALGGVRTMFLTHRDDVADHARFAAHFGCERVLHARDLTRGTREVERRLEGDRPVALDGDLLAIPVPGHTRGSTALLYRERFLFSGDHLWAREGTGRLHASRAVCWYSWPRQARSVRRLLDHHFAWVLPGHGMRFGPAAEEEIRGELSALADRMQA